MAQIYVRRPSLHAIERHNFRTERIHEIAQLIAGDVLAQQFSVGSSDPVPINQTYGTIRAGCRKNRFNEALNGLLEQGILYTDRQYIVGKRARAYTVTEEALELDFEWKSFSVNADADERYLNYVENNDTEAQKKHFFNIRPDWYRAAWEYLERKEVEGFTIDWNQFYQMKTAQQLSERIREVVHIHKGVGEKKTFFLLCELKYRFSQLHELRNGTENTYCHQSEVNGRIYSTFTQIPREFRKNNRYEYAGNNWTKWGHPAEVFAYNGKALTEVDVNNCQPVLLAALLKREGVEADKLLKDTTEGKFHARMMTALAIDPKEKDTTYKPALFHFLYGRAGDPTRNKFKDVFAWIYGAEALEFIEEHKRKHGHHELPIQLQRMEATAMIMKAARRVRHLFPSAPVLTVHDSIIVPDEEKIVKATSKAIKRAFFDLYGVEVKTTP